MEKCTSTYGNTTCSLDGGHLVLGFELHIGDGQSWPEGAVAPTDPVWAKRLGYLGGLQKYRCEVEAFLVTEIRRFTRIGDGTEVEEWTELRGADGEEVRVSVIYQAKHSPKLRGYYVLCADGREGFVSADVFEDEYTAIPRDGG